MQQRTDSCNAVPVLDWATRVPVAFRHATAFSRRRDECSRVSRRVSQYARRKHPRRSGRKALGLRTTNGVSGRILIRQGIKMASQDGDDTRTQRVCVGNDAGAAQQVLDFDMATLVRFISRIEPRRRQDLYCGLLLTLVMETQESAVIDEFGFVCMTAGFELLAKHAKVSARTLQRARNECADVEHSAGGITSRGRMAGSDWYFSLRNVLPDSSIPWFLERVHTGDMAAAQNQIVLRTASSCPQDNSGIVRRTVLTTTSDRTSIEHERHVIKTHEACSMSMPHESLRNSLVGESQVEEPAGESVRFTRISEEHVRRIVRHSDCALFERYFRDAVAAKWAKDCERDRVQMAALFHQVIRIGSADHVGKVISGTWKRRDDPDPKRRLKLAGEDEDFGGRLLKLLFTAGAPPRENRPEQSAVIVQGSASRQSVATPAVIASSPPPTSSQIAAETSAPCRESLVDRAIRTLPEDSAFRAKILQRAPRAPDD